MKFKQHLNEGDEDNKKKLKEWENIIKDMSSDIKIMTNKKSVSDVALNRLIDFHIKNLKGLK